MTVRLQNKLKKNSEGKPTQFLPELIQTLEEALAKTRALPEGACRFARHEIETTIKELIFQAAAAVTTVRPARSTLTQKDIREIASL